MQSLTSWLPTLRETLSGIGLALLSASGWGAYWLNRKKAPAEINKIEADAGLAVAQTEVARVAARAQAVDTLDRMLERVEHTHADMEVLRGERDAAREEASQVSHLAQTNHLIETQLQRARADLEASHAEAELRGLLVISLLALLHRATAPARSME